MTGAGLKTTDFRQALSSAIETPAIFKFTLPFEFFSCCESNTDNSSEIYYFN